MIASLFNTVRQDSSNLLKLFPWCEVDRGVMHNFNGFFEVGLEVEVPNTTFADNRPGLFANYHYLLRELLPPGSRIRQVQEVTSAPYADIIDYRARVNAPEPGVRWLIDKRADQHEAAWERGEVRVTRNYVLLRLGGKGKLDETKTRKRTEEAHRLRDDVALVFSRLGFDTKPMDNDDVYGLCFRFCNPDLKGIDLGPYVPTRDFYPKEMIKRSRGARASTFRAQVCKALTGNSRLDRLRLGHSYASIVALHTNPVPETRYGMFHATEQAGDNYFVVTDFYTEVAERLYTRQASKNKWYQGALETGLYVDRETVELAKSSTAMMDQLRAMNDKFMQVSSAIVMFDPDWQRLQRRTRTVYGALSHIPGNPYVILNRGIGKVFANLAPFSGNQQDLVVTTPAANAVHFMPVTGPWKGSKDPDAMWHFANPWYGTTKISPFEHVGQGGHNVVVVGGTRSGKSFGVQFMLSAALRFANTRVLVMDKGLGYKQLAGLAEGAYIDVAKEKWNPFALSQGQSEASEQDVKDIVLAVRSMAPADPGEQGEVEQSLIEEAIRNVFLFNRSELAGRVSFRTPTMTDFVKRLGTLTELNGRPLSPKQLEWKESLVTRFSRWCGNTTLGRFVDGQSTVDTHNRRFVYFDIEGIVSDPELSTTGVVLVRNFMKKYNRENEGCEIFNVLDEGWTLIKNSPIGRDMLEDSYRTAAKSRVSALTSTQSIADLPDNVLDNTRMFFIFASSQKEYRRWVEHFGLPDSVAKLASQAHIVYGKYAQALCIVKEGDSYMGQLVAVHGTGADQLTFTSEQKDKATIERVVAQHGGSFISAVESGELAA